jgi:hypothetical protein
LHQWVGSTAQDNQDSSVIEAQVNKLQDEQPFVVGPEEISAFALAGFWCCGLRPDSRAA